MSKEWDLRRGTPFFIGITVISYWADFFVTVTGSPLPPGRQSQQAAHIIPIHLWDEHVHESSFSLCRCMAHDQ